MRPIQVVRVYDPAIDKSSSENGNAVAKYAITRSAEDLAKIKMLPGKAPIVFHLQMIPRSLMRRYVELAIGDSDRYTRAFEAALVQVENLTSHDGVVVPLWRPAHKDKSAAIVSPEELELFGNATIAEIGEVAYWHSFLDPDVEHSYPLPRTSQRVLDAQAHHLAVQSLITQQTTNDSPKEPQPDQG